MKTISSVVEQVLKKHIGKDMPKLKENLSTNLEFRLIFPVDLKKSFKDAKKEFLKNYINDLLTLCLGNVSLAAKRAQLHRRHLHRILNDLDIDPNFHRRELIKPREYMKENIHNILEDTLSDFRKGEELLNIYSNLGDISEIIAQSIDLISYEEALALFEKEFVIRALKENNYSISKTAEALDMSDRTLYRKISKFNIAVA